MPYRQRHTPAHPGGKFVYGAEVIRLQLRIVFQNLLLAHSGREPAQHIPDRDAQPPNTGLSGALPRLDGNPRTHTLRISPETPFPARQCALWEEKEVVETNGPVPLLD